MAKIIVNLKSDFASHGMTDAATIIEAIRKGESTMLSIILERAMEMSENAQASADWLEGLKQGLMTGGMSKGSAQNRKSEAGAIFNAYHISHESVEAIQGGWHETVMACREIVAKANNKAPSSRNVGPRKLSDADKNKVVKRLLEADTTPSTALDIMVAAQTAYIRSAGTPDGLVRQADRLAMELQKSSDKFYVTLGERISKITTAAMEHADKMRAKAAEEGKKVQAKLEEAAKMPKPQEPGKTEQHQASVG